MPIDIDNLLQIEAIKKEGAWYRIHNMKLIPDHFMKKVKVTMTDKKGIKVKLFSQKRIASFEKRIQKSKILRDLISDST